MEILRKLCLSCRKPMNGGVYRAGHVCPHCFYAHEDGRVRSKKVRATAVPVAVSATDDAPAADTTVTPVADDVAAVTDVAAVAEVEAPVAEEAAVEATVAEAPVVEVSVAETPVAEAAPVPTVASLSLTTRSASEFSGLAILGDVAAESALNLKVTPDLFVDGKFVGARHERVKAALEQGKRQALAQVRQQALALGADTVTDIAVKNAVKSADAQAVRLLVRVIGVAAITVATDESCEA